MAVPDTLGTFAGRALIPDLGDGTELLLDDAFIARATELVARAKKSVLICAYAWRHYPNHPEKMIQQFNVAVVRKAAAGRDVRAIVDQLSQAQYLQDIGVRAKSYPTDRAMHSKAILIDDSILILGSHNLTDRGTAENYEASILTTDVDTCLLFSEYFNRMWQNYAE